MPPRPVTSAYAALRARTRMFAGTRVATLVLAAGLLVCAEPVAPAAATVGSLGAISGRVLTASPSGLVHAGRVQIQLRLPFAGRVTLIVVHRGRAIGHLSLPVATAGPQTIRVPLVPAAVRELSHGNFSAGLRVILVTRGGSRLTSAFGLRVKSTHSALASDAPVGGWITRSTTTGATRFATSPACRACSD